MDRRNFLQYALLAGLVSGSTSFPALMRKAQAATPFSQPLQNRILVNLMLHGGPDMRHFIVPEMPAVPSSTADKETFGYKYWKHRWNGHKIDNNETSWFDRWNNDFVHFDLNDISNNWSYVGSATPNTKFGIWKGAGWLIKLFTEGKVAIIANAVGSRTRAHDISQLALEQGNLAAEINKRDYSGWGGRLARTAGQNLASLTSITRGFCFGPTGSAPNFDPSLREIRDIIAVQDSRNYGLYDYDLEASQHNNFRSIMARSLKGYYHALNNEETPSLFDKPIEHEANVRLFGEEIAQRLNFPVPESIRALYEASGHNLNNHPITGASRRVSRSAYFGRQIRNLYDVLASSDILDLRVASLELSSWDSHVDQRLLEDNPDVYDGRYHGIESHFRDIFGGPNNLDPSVPHSGLSALYEEISTSTDLEKLVFTAAGEFGRQIRSNGSNGTDHGKGNIVFVFGEKVSGGVYGELFRDDEIAKYDDTSQKTPDIDGLTEFPQIFAKVCDWVNPGSANTVYPNYANTDIETGVSFANLFKA